MQRSRLVIFVKNPEKGKVKTRLAKESSEVLALDAYKKLLKYTRKITFGLEVEKEVWYSTSIDSGDIWEEGAFKKEIQKGGSIGERMQNAFKVGFQSGEIDKMILIGSDCAEISQEIIEEAFSKLDNVDVILGPAEDGGYYLIGMNSYFPQVFQNIDWSTSHVLEQTTNRIAEAELSCSLLEVLKDVDVLDDWLAVKHRFPKYD